MRYSLGIDLGATTARVSAAAEGGRLHDVGEVPLVVGLTPGGEVAVGSSALTLDEARRASGFRDFLGQAEPLLLGGTPFGVEALIAQVLRSTVDTVASDVGEWPVRIAVAHPDEWGDYQLDLLWQAAAMAEVGDVVFLTESEARAIDRAEMTSAFAIARGAARWAQPESQSPPVEPAGLPISGRTAASVLAALAGGAALGVAGATATAGGAGAGAAARIADFGGGRTMADWARGSQSMADYGGSGSRMSDFGDGKSMSDFGSSGSQSPVVQTTARAGRTVPKALIAVAAVVAVAVVAGGIALASRGSDAPEETAVGTDTTVPPPDAPTTTSVGAEDRSGLVPFIFAGSTDGTRDIEVGDRLDRTDVFFVAGVRAVEEAADGRIFIATNSEGVEIWVIEGDQIELLFRGGPNSSIVQADDMTVRGSGDELEVLIASPQTRRIARFVPATGSLDFFGNGQPTGQLPEDGIAASEAPMSAPLSVDVDGLGNLWAVDAGLDAIYRIDKDDRLTVVSGRTNATPSDGAAAADVQFPNLEVIAGHPDGGAAVVDGPAIWRINPDGTVTKLAGATAQPPGTGDQGDNGPALSAVVNAIALEFSPEGELYLGTGGAEQTIRRIDSSGVIRHIAGGHAWGGSSSPPTALRFGLSRIDIGADGQIYVAEAVANLNFLRRLPAEGVPPDTAAFGFSVIDLVGASDELGGPDGVLDHTLEVIVNADVADVIIAEGSCNADPEERWDTIIGNDAAALGVARSSLSLENDASGDLPTMTIDTPTLLAFYFQDDGSIAPGDRLCLTIVGTDGSEEETSLVIRGFDED